MFEDEKEVQDFLALNEEGKHNFEKLMSPDTVTSSTLCLWSGMSTDLSDSQTIPE